MMIGDRVTWTSQSGSYTKTKIGEIVAVVKAGSDAHVVLSTIQPKLRCNSSFGYGMPRKHDSYLVKIGNQAYWPRVKHLRIV